MGAYKYVEELWRRKQSDVLRFLLRVRAWEYRQVRSRAATRARAGCECLCVRASPSRGGEASRCRERRGGGAEYAPSSRPLKFSPTARVEFFFLSPSRSPLGGIDAHQRHQLRPLSTLFLVLFIHQNSSPQTRSMPATSQRTSGALKCVRGGAAIVFLSSVFFFSEMIESREYFSSAFFFVSLRSPRLVVEC